MSTEMGMNDFFRVIKPVIWVSKAIFKAGETGVNIARTAEERRLLKCSCQNAMIESANNRAVFCTEAFGNSSALALPYCTQETLCSLKGEDRGFFREITQTASVNMLTSGGTELLRNKALAYFCRDAIANGKTVILLHCDNQNLQQQLIHNCGGAYLPVDGKSYCYNPFGQMTPREAASILFEAIPDKYRMPYTCKKLLEIVGEIRIQSGKKLSLKSLANCPVNDILNILDKRHQSGDLTDTVYNSLLSDFVQCQNDTGVLMAYLGELKKQIDSIPSSKGTPSFDFEQAIARNSVISISVNNQLNDLLISVITEHLRELFRTNDNITVVLDGINIHSDNNLIKMLKQNSRCNFAISIEDAYASTGAKKDELNALLGGDCRLVLFRHGSPRSAEYWSEYFGEYERTEITESFTEGEKRLMTPAELKRGWAPRKTKERRILSDVFKNFSDTQFCAYDAATGRIILADVKNQ